jgi:hypothetical protein
MLWYEFYSTKKIPYPTSTRAREHAIAHEEL